MQLKKHTLQMGCAVAFWSVSSFAGATSVTIVGTLDVKQPTVTLTNTTGELIAGAKRVSFTVDSTYGACELTDNINLARQSDINTTVYCLLKVEQAQGLELNATHLFGYLDKHSTIFSPRLSLHYITPESDESYEFHSEQRGAEQVIQPMPPLATSTRSSIGGVWRNEEDYTIYNSNASMTAIEVNVEERKYPQKVSFESGGDCTVMVGSTKCIALINSDGLTMGNEEPSIKVGAKSFPYTINSLNNNFDNNFEDDIQLTWDYRPPIAEGLSLYAVDESNEIDSINMEVDGHTVIVSNGRARAAIRTPHIGLAGDWWIPEKVKITFTPLAGQTLISSLKHGDVTLFSSSKILPDSIVEIDSLTAPIRVGDAYVYDFDLDDVPDGEYRLKLDVADKHGNKSELTLNETKSLSRERPTVKVFRNHNELRNGEAFYFPNELIIAGYNGRKDDVSITSIAVNGVPIATEGEREDIRKINHETFNFVSNQDYDFDITIKDKAGNITKTSKKLTFAPISFEALAKDLGRKPYLSVEMTGVTVAQTGGEACRYYSTPEVAIKYSKPGRLGCVFVWDELPASFTSNTGRAGPTAFGYTTEVSERLNYHVEVYSRNGDMFATPQDHYIIDSQTPEVPKLTLSSRNQLENGMFPVSVLGGDVLRATSLSQPGKINLSFAYTKKKEIIERSPSRMKSPLFSVTGKMKINDKHEEVALWDVVSIPVESKYERMPELKSQDIARVLVVPDKNISMSLDFNDELILTTDTVKATVNFGRFSRADKSYQFDESMMGQWDISVGYYNRRNGMEPLTQVKRLDANGQVEFEMPMDVINGKSGTMVAEAVLVSPVAEYSRKIMSRKTHFVVYKGSEIEGKINMGQVVDRIPLRTNLYYSPKSRADYLAMGEVIWEKSTDGINWTVEDEQAGETRRKKTYTEPGIEYVRVKTTNKFNGTESTTAPVKVVAFERPTLNIKQVAPAFIDEAATFELTDMGESANLANGDIQWSTDGRKTWLDGSNSMSFTRDEISNRFLYARMRYKDIASDEDVGDKGYAETKVRYTFSKKALIVASIKAPREVETNQEVALSGVASSRIKGFNERLRTEWLLPDGSTVSGDQLTLKATEDYIHKRVLTVSFRAWIDGLKEQTLQTTSHKIKTWKYEFPESALTVQKSTLYAPAKTFVKATLERHYAPGVSYTYKLEPSDAYEELSHENGKFVINILKAGVHLVNVIITNDRGEESKAQQYIEALPPLPLSIEFINNFSNNYNRYPLDIASRSRVLLGHKKDSVLNYTWTVDGVVVNDKGRYRQMISGLNTGKHNIQLDVLTNFGQRGTAEFDVTVNPNVEPHGELTQTDKGEMVQFLLSCTDTDGKIVAHSWELNGEKLTFGHNKIDLSKSKLEPQNTIQGSCWDDSYSSYESTITFTN